MASLDYILKANRARVHRKSCLPYHICHDPSNSGLQISVSLLMKCSFQSLYYLFANATSLLYRDWRISFSRYLGNANVLALTAQIEDITERPHGFLHMPKELFCTLGALCIRLDHGSRIPIFMCGVALVLEVVW